MLENDNNSKNFLGVDNYGYETSNRKISPAPSFTHTNIGPVRKKSTIYKTNEIGSFPSQLNDLEINRTNDSNRIKKNSTVSTKSHYSCRSHISTRTETIEENQCHSPDEEKPSWEPEFWRQAFPKPYFPSYRTISRIIALTLIGALAWCFVYAIVGDSAAPPDGQLYQLMLLSICAYFGGWLMSLTTLPALIGMLFTGMLLQNINVVDIDSNFAEMSHVISDIAVVMILTRAGLDLDPTALSKLKFTVLKLSTIPWLAEALVVMLMARYCIDISWSYSLLLGSIIAAVAPAVVVPCLFRLRAKGYGVAKGIPTLILAVASIDDSLSVAIFGIIKSFVFSESVSTTTMILGPLSIVGGLVFGIIWGLICNFVPERNDPFVVPLRVLVLLSGNVGAVFGSSLLGYSGAGPLSCVTSAFVAVTCWSRTGWDVEDNPVGTSFEIFWMIFQPILFGLTGARIKLNELEGGIVLICAGIIVAGILVKMLITVFVGIGCNLNLKEKIFISIPWMCKAIMQAALGGTVISLVKEETEEYETATKVLNICILSIIISAPIGALLTTFLGPHLLTKAQMTPLPEVRMRKKSRRLSIRDISIEEVSPVTPTMTLTIIQENEIPKDEYN